METDVFKSQFTINGYMVDAVWECEFVLRKNAFTVIRNRLVELTFHYPPDPFIFYANGEVIQPSVLNDIIQKGLNEMSHKIISAKL